MNRDDIIRMAREAEFVNLDLCSSELERFAALVAAAEREACLKLADSLGWVNVDHIRAREQL